MIFLAESVSLQLKATHKTDATQQNSGQMHFLGANSPTAPCPSLKREVTMVGWLDARCSASDFFKESWWMHFPGGQSNQSNFYSLS